MTPASLGTATRRGRRHGRPPPAIAGVWSLLWLAVAGSAAARQPAPPPEGTAWEALKQLAIQPLVTAESVRDRLSAQILATADRIDGFFADQRMASDSNGSYVQLDGFVRGEEHRKPLYGLLLRSKLDLPRTEERLKLIVESEEARVDDPAADRLGAGDPLSAAEETRYSLGLRYLARQSRRLNLQMDAGVRLGSRPRLFLRGRLRRAEAFRTWAARFTQTLAWLTDDGWVAGTRVDFDRPLSERWFFRSSSDATWTEVNQFFDLSQNFVLFQSLDADRSLSYRFGVFGASQPDVHSTEVILDLRFRRRIHETWLFYEIHPALRYPRQRDFNVTPSLQFTLSIVFGD